MNNRLKPASTASLAVLVLTFALASVAEAKHDDLRYEYHFGDDFFALCIGVKPTDAPVPPDPGGGATCRPEATAEDFSGISANTIAIQGSGELRITKKGKPKDVKGSGTYARFETDGTLVDSGTWKAKKLLLFDAYGPDTVTPLPPTFESGRVFIKIELKPENGKKSKKVDAILEVGCRLPGSPGIIGTIEGVRVAVAGTSETEGLYYNIASDPKSTLFVKLD